MDLQNKMNKVPAAVILVAMVCAALSPANAAQPTKGQVVSNLMLPFDQTAAVTLGDSSELVDFSGTIHLQVTVSIPTDPLLPPNPIRIHTNVTNVTGIGQTTGLTYRLSGSTSLSFPFSDSYSFATSYRLIPDSRTIGPLIRDLSFDVGYLVSLNSEGQVTQAEAFPTIIEE